MTAAMTSATSARVNVAALDVGPEVDGPLAFGVAIRAAAGSEHHEVRASESLAENTGVIALDVE